MTNKRKSRRERRKEKAMKQADPVEKARRIAGERERTGKGGATVERILRAGDGFEVLATGGHRVTEAPLDRLWSRGAITEREFQAGDQFRTDAFAAKIDPGAAGINWDGVGRYFGPKMPTMFTAQAVADARIRYRLVVRKLGPSLEAVLDAIVVHEHSPVHVGRTLYGCSGERQAQTVGTAAFRTALGALADHYEGRRT